VSLLGVVRSQAERSAGVVYTLDDSSGEIDAVSYMNDAGAELDHEDAMQQEDLTGRYVKVGDEQAEPATEDPQQHTARRRCPALNSVCCSLFSHSLSPMIDPPFFACR